eukprot:CAMPEP_0117661078 /NCGR_PEP_ID=MMETSP0804-20121206/7350_1 /TAXON_ID=1074897 /ORGANISM="Tetraselmis astigmatica, Strain CCMP880" /LENGTH=787 /DNA_ID=CAMNT_0005467931 /DNA_START=277 /DNA_END=2640 /DNA_ORIENTATION=+
MGAVVEAAGVAGDHAAGKKDDSLLSRASLQLERRERGVSRVLPRQYSWNSGTLSLQEKLSSSLSRSNSTSPSPPSTPAPQDVSLPVLTPSETPRSELTPRGSNSSAYIPVSVVLNIRPMLGHELKHGHQNCLKISNERELPEVSLVHSFQSRSFPFDKVYGEGAAPGSELFDDCVAPLMDGLFEGFNATILAYGQTGAGKTFTIGTQPQAAKANKSAVIPRLTTLLFEKAANFADDGGSSVTVTVSFIELYQNSIYDLLADNRKQSSVSVRDHGSRVVPEGQREVPVTCAAEVDACLQQGIAARTAHTTNMNHLSSRSHAIFTVSLVVKRWRASPNGAAELGGSEEVEETLTSKMHIVDLAGSERLKRSGAQGQQKKEAASINLGLLSLRNCIEALCRPGQGHVPYRSHKLTRLLQDGLGGNARTVMIACVNPSNGNVEETLNTLQYTSNARKIKNKLVANRDEQRMSVPALEMHRDSPEEVEAHMAGPSLEDRAGHAVEAGDEGLGAGEGAAAAEEALLEQGSDAREGGEEAGKHSAGMEMAVVRAWLKDGGHMAPEEGKRVEAMREGDVEEGGTLAADGALEGAEEAETLKQKAGGIAQAEEVSVEVPATCQCSKAVDRTSFDGYRWPNVQETVEKYEQALQTSPSTCNTSSETIPEAKPEYWTEETEGANLPVSPVLPAGGPFVVEKRAVQVELLEGSACVALQQRLPRHRACRATALVGSIMAASIMLALRCRRAQGLCPHRKGYSSSKFPSGRQSALVSLRAQTAADMHLPDASFASAFPIS